MATENPESKRKAGGGKLSRSETVTVRLDPKLRYLTELAARLHRRTSSSYIEWAIKASLDTEALRPTGTPSMVVTDTTIGSEAEYLWDVDDADRFAKLALRYPHLMTHEEQVLWKLIRENGYLWKGSFAGRGKEWMWTVDEDSFIFQRLREHWIAFSGVAESDIGQADLPTWRKTEQSLPPPPTGSPTGPPRRLPSKPPPATGFDDMDDDIPF